MPFYDYKCNNCGATVEILLRGSDGNTVKCPKCDSPDVDRLFSSSYQIVMKI